MALIGIIDILMRADKSKLEKGLKDGKKEVSGFASTISKMGGGAIGTFTKRATALAAPAAAFLTVSKVISGVGQKFEELTTLNKTAGRLGIDTDQLQAMQAAYKKVGLEGEAAGGAIVKMQKNIGEAGQGGSSPFKELGLDLQTLKAQNPAEQFRTITDAIAKIPSQTDRVRLAFKIFGREGGAGVAAAFKDGSKVLDEMRAKAAKFGTLVKPEEAQQVAAASKALKEYKLVWEGLWTRLSVNVAPLVEGLFQTLTSEALKGKESVVDAASGFDVWIDVLGAVLDLWGAFKAGVNVLISGVVALGGAFAWVGEKIGLLDESWSQASFGVASDYMDYAGELTSGKSHAERIRDNIKTSSRKRKKEQTGEYEYNEDQTKLVEKYQAQLATMGMTARQAEIYKVGQDAVSASLAKELQSLDQLLTAQEVQQELLKQDPIHQYQQNLERYNTALKRGTITQAQYNEFLAKQKEDITGLIDPVAKLRSEMEKQQRFATLTGNDPAKVIRNLKQEFLGIQDPFQQFNDRLADLAKALGDGITGPIGLSEYTRAVAKAKTDLSSSLGFESIQGQLNKSKQQIENLRKWSDINGVKKDSQEYKDLYRQQLPSYISGMMDQTQSPIEKLKEDLQRLKENSATLAPEDRATFVQRGSQYLTGQYLQSRPTLQFATAATAGSQEARMAVLRNRYGSEMGGDKEILQSINGNGKNQVDKLDSLIRVVTKVAENTAKTATGSSID